MQYGAMNFPVLPVMDEIKKIAGLGLDYLELTMDPPMAHHYVIRQHADEIRRVLEDNSLGLVCHLPTFVYTADLTESIRKSSVDEMLQSLDAAAELGASKAVLHPAMISGMGGFVMDIVRKYAMESLEAITQKAERRGIRLCLENMIPRYGHFYQPREFVEFFDIHPNFGLTLDVGHANIDNEFDDRALDFIESLDRHIGHIHLSDNSGERDEHLPIGSGTVDFPQIAGALKKIGYDDTITLEVFSGKGSDLKSSRDRFAALIDKS